MRGVKGIFVFTIFLYGVVLATYATQDRTGGGKAKLIPMQSTSCSSSSSSSSSGGPAE